MRPSDCILVDTSGWVLAKRKRYPGEGDGAKFWWYLVYHRHDEELSPMVSRINSEGKAMGYKCMSCREPIHEGLQFLQKMMEVT